MLEIISPALIAAILISLTHGLLGIKVLKKGIIFIDLAIAQIAGLGLIIAGVFFPHSGLIGQLIALFFAITASLFFYYIDKKSSDIQEAIIGCSFIFAACLSFLFLSNHAHGGDEIKHLLSGEMLFITFKDVLFHAPIYLLAILIWFLKPQIRNGIGFYLIFAIIITSSVQLVGVYVVFASLIVPAILVRKSQKPILFAWIFGIFSVLFGIILAIYFDLPAGIMVVISYISLALGISLFEKIRLK